MSFDRLRIGIATTGRFHVLDLARELDALGHDVAFYTMVPPKRAQSFGLPARAHRFLPELLPLAAAVRYGPKAWRGRIEQRFQHQLNRAVISRLEPCDVFIGMSGLILEAADYARDRFGAKIFIERGSRHIVSQAEILAAIPGADRVPQFAVERELAGYQRADCVVVPSLHAELSFIERGFPPSRLFRNAYGVDVDIFRPPAVRSERPRGCVVFVGSWALQKGADMVIRLIRDDDTLSLLHAGTIGDIVFPKEGSFHSVGHVDQSALQSIYAQARVLVLPSHQDGFGMVLAQALACGVPVVCSDRTGGEDIKVLVNQPDAVAIVPAGNQAAFAEAVRGVLTTTEHLVGTDLLGENGRAALSWSAYGRRYADRLSATRTSWL